MEVSRVSFGAKYSKTPNGNYYKKKNTGKHIGTMVGLAGGITLAALPPAQLLSLSAAGKLFPKSMGKQLGATYGFLLAGVTAFTLLCRGLGSIPDSAINKKRISKADNIA